MPAYESCTSSYESAQEVKLLLGVRQIGEGRIICLPALMNRLAGLFEGWSITTVSEWLTHILLKKGSETQVSGIRKFRV